MIIILIIIFIAGCIYFADDGSDRLTREDVEDIFLNEPKHPYHLYSKDSIDSHDL